MNQILVNCLTSVITICITALSTIIIKLISAKISNVIAKTEDEKKIRFLQWLQEDVIVKCINSTTQTYVEQLKKDNCFTEEAQKEAINITKSQVLGILNDANTEMLSTYVGDINVWLTAYIESYLLKSKM